MAKPTDVWKGQFGWVRWRGKIYSGHFSFKICAKLGVCTFPCFPTPQTEWSFFPLRDWSSPHHHTTPNWLSPGAQPTTGLSWKPVSLPDFWTPSVRSARSYFFKTPPFSPQVSSQSPPTIMFPQIKGTHRMHTQIMHPQIQCPQIVSPPLGEDGFGDKKNTFFLSRVSQSKWHNILAQITRWKQHETILSKYLKFSKSKSDYEPMSDKMPEISLQCLTHQYHNSPSEIWCILLRSFGRCSPQHGINQWFLPVHPSFFLLVSSQSSWRPGGAYFGKFLKISTERALIFEHIFYLQRVLIFFQVFFQVPPKTFIKSLFENPIQIIYITNTSLLYASTLTCSFKF